jgi:hypothetical protein
MSDHSRTYKIELPADAAVTPSRIRRVARQQLKNGAQLWDFIEVKQGKQIVSFRKIGDLVRAAVETVRESADAE